MQHVQILILTSRTTAFSRNILSLNNKGKYRKNFHHLLKNQELNLKPLQKAISRVNEFF